MQFTLIIQIPEELINYDKMVDLEELVSNSLDINTEEVDGHDIGGGEVNIFVLTKNPEATFKSIKKILNKDDCLMQHVKIAYREAMNEQYKILWPPGLDEFHVA